MRLVAKHIRLFVSDGEIVPAFNLVKRLQSLAPPAPKWDVQETTPLETPELRKEFLPTIAQEGPLSFMFLCDADDPVHAQLVAASEDGTLLDFRLWMNLAGQRSFSGFIKNFKWGTPVGNFIEASFELEVSGAAVDDIAPTITAVEFVDEHYPTYETGDIMRVRVSFDEYVDVDFDPEGPGLTLDIDGSPAEAVYAGELGRFYQLVFEYEIQAEDVAEAASFALASPLVLNDATLKDEAGNDATLTFTPPDTGAVTINPS